VTLAYREVAIEQGYKAIWRLRSRMLSRLKTMLAGIDAELAGSPNDPGLRRQRSALAARLPELEVPFYPTVAAVRVDRYLRRDVAAVPGQPIQPRPGRIVSVAIGMLVGLLVAGALAWWRRRRQGPTSRSSAPEQGSEMPPSPA
jgi:MYXO-CTERM domain-containing protein